MSQSSESASEASELTYRERSVEEDLDEHDSRISRLEKALLIAVGYVLAEQNSLIDAALGLVL